MSDLIKRTDNSVSKIENALVFKNQQVKLIDQTHYSKDIKKVMKLAVDVKFSHLSIEEKILTVSNCIEAAYTRTGSIKLNPEEKTFFINEVIDILKDRVYVTRDELIEIFKKGSLGILGEYYGVNVKSFSQWIDIFYKDVHRREVIKKLNDLQSANDKVIEMTPIESQNLIKKAIIEVFEFRRENHQTGIEGISYPMYDYLFRKKIINLTDQEKKYLREEAVDYIQITYSASKGKLTELLDKSLIDPIKMAKTLAVRDYMNKAIEIGAEIEI